MKRMLLLLTVSAMAVLVFAPAATAQGGQVPPPFQPMPGFNQPDYLNPAYNNPEIPGSGTETPTAPAPKVDPAPKVENNPGAEAKGKAEAKAGKAESKAAKELPNTGGSSHALPVTLAILALVVSGFAVLRFVLRRGAAS